MAKNQKAQARSAKRSARRKARRVAKKTKKPRRVKAPKRQPAKKSRRAAKRATVRRALRKAPKAKKAVSKKAASKKASSKKASKSTKPKKMAKSPKKLAKSSKKASKPKPKKSVRRARTAPKRRKTSKKMSRKARILASLQSEVTFAEHKPFTPIPSKPKKQAKGLRSSSRVSRPPKTLEDYKVDTPKRTSRRKPKTRQDTGNKRKRQASKASKSKRRKVKAPKRAAPSSSEEPEDEAFEVEKILDMELRKGTEMFLIKWKGYSSKSNTWEPRKNLTGCDLALEKFLDGFGYEVEYICGSRTIHGNKQYKVKWMGYPASENTWEPAKNLKSAKQAIEQFEKRLNSNKKSKSARKVKLARRPRRKVKASLSSRKSSLPFTRSRARSRDPTEVSERVPHTPK